jgi:hypothetical protein
MKGIFGLGGPIAPGSAFFHPWSRVGTTAVPTLPDWLLHSSQKLSKSKKIFVKGPLSAPIFGQNKTFKLCQNNVVINTVKRS